MMFSRPLGGSTELVEIIEFDGPDARRQMDAPGCHAAHLDANAAWLQDRFWAPRTNRTRLHVSAVAAEDERRDRPHRHRLRKS